MSARAPLHMIMGLPLPIHPPTFFWVKVPTAYKRHQQHIKYSFINVLRKYEVYDYTRILKMKER